MLAGLVVSLISFGASVVVAQSSSPVIVCVAGQCLQGLSNVSIGTKLSAGGTSMFLLPGQYTTTTNPALLHGILTSPSASLTPSPGFNTNSATVSLPLNVALQPGLSTYSSAAYSGTGSFTPLPSTPSTNTSTLTPLSPFASLSLAANTWTALSAGTSRLIVWDSIPDIAQLPASSVSGGALSLLDIQLDSCSPPCSSSGVCSPTNGTCSCLPGFTGASCESCASGFFGPTCQPCPTGCTSCDDGLSGTGVCKTPVVANAPSTCNCLNGACSGNTCTCIDGWTTASNGTQCAACATGFYLDSQTGSCQVCGIGCTQCADGNGNCSVCKPGFSASPTDPTRCIDLGTTASPTQKCLPGTFSDSLNCVACSPACKECTGATSADCLLCANDTYMSGTTCVAVDANGVCGGGGGLVANNAKNECDTCGAKCTTCKIPNFTSTSSFSSVQCTGCVPGFVLSQGKCVESCPSGTFLDPKDNLTCTACDSSCSTCAGSATNCLTCTNNLLASAGKCVSTCPSNTIGSSGTCQTCHPDCATCSGTSFTQCSSCPPNRPVLTGGRCMPTCSKTQFFDKTSNACVACDSSCSSCSGSGPSNCLACSASNMVLKAGTCTAASCTSGSSVVPGLGLCLSDIVNVPAAAGNTPIPPGLNTPTPTSRRLAWWEILLMALGCAFIFLVILMCWRRRARNQRAKRTAQFANAKAIDPNSWRMKLVRFGERLFGHKPSVVVGPGVGLQGETEEIRLLKLRNAEEARHHREMEKLQLIDKYDYPRSVRSMSTHRTKESFHDAPSMYSQVTGQPRSVPEPRIPVRNGGADLPLPPNRSRFSDSTISTWMPKEAEALPAMPTAASSYAAEVSANKTGASGGSKFAQAWMVKPTPTGASDNNPFRKPSF